MKTYVTGIIDKEKAGNGNLSGVIGRLSPVGYKFAERGDHYEFTKIGRVESVITEMVPVCEDHGLDVEDFNLIERRLDDDTERSRYEDGKIIRST